MRTVTAITAYTDSAALRQRVQDRLRNSNMINSMRPNMETGGTLNKQGDSAFRMRVNALLKENGIEGNLAFGRVDDNVRLGIDLGGRHIVLSNHADKEKGDLQRQDRNREESGKSE